MKIGLGLSGGGARGIGHLGILKALEELELRPQVMSGVSAGAIVGALYAARMTPDEIMELITTTKLLRYFGLARNLRGLLHMEKTREIYAQCFKVNDFGCLSMPLFIGATNLTQGKTVYFSSGELIKPLQASSAIPVVFSPVEIDGDHYADGGILNNLPVEPLIGHCDVIIGSHVNPLQENMPIRNIKQVLERTAYLAITMNTVESRRQCHWFIEPPELSKFSVLDMQGAKEMFRIGYEFTLKTGENFLKKYAQERP